MRSCGPVPFAVTVAQRGSSLKTGPAGHAKIVLDITAVEFDQFSLYSTSTGTMTIYDRLSL